MTDFDELIQATPPADSDVDASFTVEATAVDGSDSAVGSDNFGIDVDAVADGAADGLSVSISVNDSGDADSEFSPGETGTVSVSASFGDFTDGSETHTVVVDIPTGFAVVAPLPGAPAGVTAVVNGDGDVELTVATGTESFADYQFQVTAPDSIADGDSFSFTAVARAEETPGDNECTTGDNVATVEASAEVAGGAAGTPDVGLVVQTPDGCIKEDTETDVLISADTATPGDSLTQVVVTAPAGWVLGAAIGGDITGVAGDGSNVLTLTLAGGVTDFDELIQATPLADSDVDAGFTVEATAVDGSDSATGDASFGIDVDAVADGAADGLSVEILSVTDSGDVNTTFAKGESGTMTVKATFGDNSDGSEVHSVSISVPAGFSYDQSVNSLPSGVTFDAVNSTPATAVFLVESTGGLGSVEIDLAITNDTSDDGLVQFSAEARAVEQNTNTDPNAGDVECHTGDNTAVVSDSEGATVEAAPVLVVGENVDDMAGQTEDHRVSNPNGQPDGEIIGDNGNDVLIGDVGGGELVNKTSNIALVLDTSGSMDAPITFNGVATTRIEALDLAVENLLDNLAGTVGVTVRVHLVSFATTVKEVGTFDIVTDGVVDTAALQAAKDFVFGPGDTVDSVASGFTNYESGFQAALDWFSDPANTLDNPDFNQTIFVSDGKPNTAFEGNGTSSLRGFLNGQDALNHVLGSAPGSSGTDDGDNEDGIPPDTVSEYDALFGPFEGVAGTVDAVGISVDAAGDALLDQIDDDGDADNISSGEELEQVLEDLTQVNAIVDVGSDVITGNAGNDLIFGDAIFTDLLADDQGIILPAGSGWGVVEQLVTDGFFDQDPARTETEEIVAFLSDPANVELFDFGRESLVDGVGRGGGNDTIDGGSGDDLIFGQEGDDEIDGGADNDTIIGGTGNDSMTGGLGMDSFVIEAASGGLGETDTISDFGVTPGSEDVLDLSDLLSSGSFAGADLADAVAGGFVTLSDNGTDTTITVDLSGAAGGSQVDYTIILENTLTTDIDSTQVDVS